MAASTNLFRYVPVEANQNYVLTYKVRMSNETLQATAICPYNGRSTNYQAFYFKPKTTLVDEVETPTDPATFYNVPGSKETISNASEVANGEWQELSYSYSPTEDGYICMFFGNLVANECFGDFGVYPASEVSDDRGVKDALAQVEFYIANKELLPNEQETLEGIKEMLEGYLANESKDEVNGFLQGLNTNNDETDPFKFFLDANTVDLAQDKYVKNFYNGGTSWTATGGNWGTASAKGNFNTQYVNQYMKQPGKNSTALAVGDYYQTFDLPAGKYLLTAKGRAAGDVTLTLFAGENIVEMPAVGASGALFDRGWDDTSVEFVVAEEGPVTIGVRGVTTAQYNWMSFSNFRLVQLSATSVGISTVNAAKQQSGVVYNLQGQQVEKAQKGLYIMNGKKVVVK
jgi:hypothetical protein